MTATPSDPTPDLRPWAARQLGVEPGAAPAEARAAFFRRLADADFVPPRAWADAYRLLTSPNPPDPAHATSALAEEEERWRAEVEAFATDFFQIPAADRRLRWQRLAEVCGAFPALSARLEGLKLGLSVEADEVYGRAPQFRGLVEPCCELFVLRPEERAARRQELLQEIGWDRDEWRLAAQRLRHQYPAVAALEPQWLAQVEGCPQPVLGSADVPRSDGGWVIQAEGHLGAGDGWLIRTEGHLQPTARSGPTPPPSSGGPGASVGVIAVVLMVVLRVLAGLASSGGSSSPPPYVRPEPLRPVTAKLSPDEERIMRLLREHQSMFTHGTQPATILIAPRTKDWPIGSGRTNPTQPWPSNATTIPYPPPRRTPDTP